MAILNYLFCVKCPALFWLFILFTRCRWWFTRCFCFGFFMYFSIFFSLKNIFGTIIFTTWSLIKLLHRISGQKEGNFTFPPTCLSTALTSSYVSFPSPFASIDSIIAPRSFIEIWRCASFNSPKQKIEFQNLPKRVYLKCQTIYFELSYLNVTFWNKPVFIFVHHVKHIFRNYRSGHKILQQKAHWYIQV